MVSNNQLLGKSNKVTEEKVKVVEVDEKLGWAKRLYHSSCLAGKVFQTLFEQNEQKELGWVESPADIGKEAKETTKEIGNKLKDVIAKTVSTKKTTKKK